MPSDDPLDDPYRDEEWIPRSEATCPECDEDFFDKDTSCCEHCGFESE